MDPLDDDVQVVEPEQGNGLSSLRIPRATSGSLPRALTLAAQFLCTLYPSSAPAPI